jgi:Membrane carboxypeptidase/penicillin-binding protein
LKQDLKQLYQIFEEFVKKAIKKSDAKPFKVPEDITLMVVDPNTGNKAKFSSKNTIIESYKSKNISNGKILYSNNNRLDTNNILRFY